MLRAMTYKRRAISIVAAAAVAGGAAFAAVSATSSTQASTTANTQQAATLSQLVSSAGTVTRHHPRRFWLARLRRLGGLHGQFTFHTKHGTRTLAFERGTIASVTPTSIVVRATDGTTWTWLLTSKTIVRDKGAKATRSALSTGEAVFTAGPVSTARDARLVAIPLHPGSFQKEPSAWAIRTMKREAP